MEQPSFTVQLENTEPVAGILVTEASSWDELFALCKQQNELIRDLRNTIANLSESVAYLTRKLYGSSREKLPISGQLDLFGNVAETGEAIPESPASVSEELLPSDENSGKKSGKGREATSKSYIWLIVTGDDGLAPIITYHYSPSRGHKVPEGLLGDFKGYFHTDKYDGYNCLEGHVVRCLCWAHGRRKWYDAIPVSLKNRDRSKIKDLNDLTVAEIGFLAYK